jgi:hypothetical protein
MATGLAGAWLASNMPAACRRERIQRGKSRAKASTITTIVITKVCLVSCMPAFYQIAVEACGRLVAVAADA